MSIIVLDIIGKNSGSSTLFLYCEETPHKYISLQLVPILYGNYSIQKFIISREVRRKKIKSMPLRFRHLSVLPLCDYLIFFHILALSYDVYLRYKHLASERDLYAVSVIERRSAIYDATH